MSGLLLNGLLPGDKPLERSPSHFPIEKPNYSNMETILKKNLQPNYPPPITKSSYMILPSETKLAQDKTPSLPTYTSSLGSTQPLSCQMELMHTDHHSPTRNRLAIPQTVNKKFVTDTTLEPDAGKLVTPRPIAWQGASEVYGLQPKYLWHNLWHNLWENSSMLSPTTAEWSEYATPLPRPPVSETTNPIIHKMITDNPDLFQIVTPIKIDVFKKLLINHPNQPFIQSVCAGLCEGFWLWADSLHEDLPITHDELRLPSSDLEKASFVHNQCMYSMPIHAVEKPNSTNLCLVTDHSAGPFSLNHMIDHSKVTGFPLDNLHHLGEILLDIRHSLGNVPLTMWKSDISEAYHLPVSPYWQIEQIITVDGICHVHNLAFGSSALPAIFILFNSLVAWIAKYEKFFDYLADYIDDSSGCDLEGDTMFYKPYSINLPTHQKQLLDLWDELRIPHKHHKQLSRTPLTIIGISVNPNDMTLTLPDSAKTHLLDELLFWASKPPKPLSRSFKLKHWERMTSWFNWALNVYPYLCTALNNNDFEWAINHLRSSSSIRILKSVAWTPSIADFTIYCDACLDGLGYWYPDSKEGYYAPAPINVPTNVIFYFKSLCVLSALTHVQTQAPPGSKIVIYSDNSNTILWVLHVPGKANIIANALSRIKFSVALALKPSLKVFSFHPPGIAHQY
ncbi:hypothetical protein BYT27DRAFT_7222633 [Phlegmacium glaucopus]|nr:hypothetical protein BYT27DRAFT_7222633 [Phlegmacium glaucopus]